MTEWRVEGCDQDYSVYGPDGQLMRPVPCKDGMLAGFRPSYWYSKNQTSCMLPSR